MAKTIAWIEDDANIIWPVIRPLEDRGYDIVVLESMREALDKIEVLRNCDLILLDVILPAGDNKWKVELDAGVQLLRQLREQSVITPVLAFTVMGNLEKMKELRELGVADILSKPIAPSKLEAAVIAVLGEE